VRVVLADDAVLIREGIAHVLESRGFDVVTQTGDAEGLLRAVAALEPDVAIVDIRMPPTHTHEGLVAALEIRERYPRVGVMILSQYVESHYALELLGERPQGAGYLLKDRVSDISEFSAAVQRIAEGGSVIDPEVVAELLGRRRRRGPIDDLSARELEVLAAMAEGRSNQAIAQRLFLSPKTIEAHVSRIFSKLQLTSSDDDNRRVLAVLTYLESAE
jgi:DNA-binding NarL/FixJ family response regulator